MVKSATGDKFWDSFLRKKYSKNNFWWQMSIHVHNHFQTKCQKSTLSGSKKIYLYLLEENLKMRFLKPKE